MSVLSPTELQLLALHEAPAVRLEDICDHYLALGFHTARCRAVLNELPFPTFKISDSQKAPLMVKLSDLARFLDARHKAATEEWAKSQV